MPVVFAAGQRQWVLQMCCHQLRQEGIELPGALRFNSFLLLLLTGLRRWHTRLALTRYEPLLQAAPTVASGTVARILESSFKWLYVDAQILHHHIGQVVRTAGPEH